MNVAILHYHLNPGGVTRVIANHLLSLDATAGDREQLRVLLLFDGQTDGWPDELEQQLTSTAVAFRSIPSLRYQDQPGAGTLRMLDDIRRAFSVEGFTPDETILHAHNHSLGKNARYPAVLRQLAEDGYALLLQPHDFAEDFRPAYYRHLRDSFDTDDISQAVYFQGPRVHYATLNRRDFDLLRSSGVVEDRLHFLPNPVPDTGRLPSRDEARTALQVRLGIGHDAEYVLYPVRGIRRKNVGELLLLALLRQFLTGQSVGAITLDPLSPTALPIYVRWKALTAELDSPCRFGVGGDGGLSFGENLAAADRIVTTSVAEGFGMVFLESWLAGRPLVGRNLPEITADFTDAGLNLEALYDRLAVPLDWVGRHAVIESIHNACLHVYADYGLPVPDRDNVAATIDRLTADGTIDFGILDESLQEVVIRRAASSAADCGALLDRNPQLTAWNDVQPSTIDANQHVIRDQYSLHASGRRLRVIYDRLLQSPSGPLESPADGDSILQSFLALDRIRLIRT